MDESLSAGGPKPRAVVVNALSRDSVEVFEMFRKCSAETVQGEAEFRHLLQGPKITLHFEAGGHVTIGTQQIALRMIRAFSPVVDKACTRSNVDEDENEIISIKGLRANTTIEHATLHDEAM